MSDATTSIRRSSTSDVLSSAGVTFSGYVRRTKTRAHLVGALNKYAGWCMSAVLPFDASPKIQNILRSASAPCWAMMPEKCASSGGQQGSPCKVGGGEDPALPLILTP